MAYWHGANGRSENFISTSQANAPSDSSLTSTDFDTSHKARAVETYIYHAIPDIVHLGLVHFNLVGVPYFDWHAGFN